MLFGQHHCSSCNVRLEQESQLHVKNITQNACQGLLHGRKNQEDIVNVAASFRGFWFSRGWSSTTGCMVAIPKKTGRLLDSTMLCNHCNKCEAWKSKREIGEVDAL